ncbi:unnamed protein product [Symbiodinium sp. CCMP2592]|nr:unnamed protein product [Symbiodinium sp. CCMP2592]
MAALPRALILLGLCYLSSSEDARCDDARCSGAADDTGLLQGSRRLAEAQRAEFPSPKDMYNALEDLGDEAVKKLKDRAEDHWKHYLKVARDAKDQAEIAADVAIKARNAARKYGSEALEKSADVIQKVLADAIAFKCDLLTRVAETILESLTSWWSSGTIDKKACKQMKSQSEKTCKLARLWPQEHWEDWIVDLCVNGSKTAIDWTCDEVKDLFHQTAVDIRNHMGAASLGCSGASWPFLYETALPQGSRRLLSSRSSERPARSRLDIFDDIGKAYWL